MKNRFEKALTFQQYLDEMPDSQHPWRELYSRARVHDAVLQRARLLHGKWKLLVLSEGWCGDGANTIPYLAKLTEALPNLEMRILHRDENPDLMDDHLTGENRAIPVVMILDEDFQEVAWWGPRPAPLQEIFLREIEALPKPERYPRLRAWYAQDRGKTTLEEVLSRIPILV